MDYRAFIKITEDFPRPGISFKDISPLLADGPAFRAVIDDFAQLAAPAAPDLIVGPEARGFVFGTALAYRMGCGFVMARKEGKLPGAVLRADYDLEYGSAALYIPSGLIPPGSRVLLIDDLLATGGTMRALSDLIEKSGSQPVLALALIELKELGGTAALGSLPHRSLISYER